MWKFIKTGTEVNCKLFGVDIFDYEWNDTGQEIEVRDPMYNQKHLLNIYDVYIGEEIITFASGEFSNGVYGFYVEERKRNIVKRFVGSSFRSSRRIHVRRCSCRICGRKGY